jgi:hypothetical protein
MGCEGKIGKVDDAIFNLCTFIKCLSKRGVSDPDRTRRITIFDFNSYFY